ncbi:MAG TPA: hypothetical protein VHO91_10790 [Rhodopila sp.]|nr:hypothetical protein [Rhodopila sp.]
MDRIVCEPMWATAIDHSGAAIGKSERAQMVWRQRQKAMGIRPSHLDWYVYQRDTGIFAQIELKHGDGQPTDGQCVTMRLLRERGIPTGCCWSVRDFYEALTRAGFRLHPEAAAIASEIEAKHGAADLAARTKQPKAAKRQPRPRPIAVPPELPADLADLFR